MLPLSSFSICNGPWHPLYSFVTIMTSVDIFPSQLAFLSRKNYNTFTDNLLKHSETDNVYICLQIFTDAPKLLLHVLSLCLPASYRRVTPDRTEGLKTSQQVSFFGNDGAQIFICGKKVVLRPFALGWMTFPSSIAVKSMIRLYRCVEWYMRGTSTTLYGVI